MKTDVLLGVVSTFSSLVGFIVAIYLPSKRAMKALFACFFVLSAIVGVFLVVRQSHETEVAQGEAEKARKRAEGQLDEARATVRRIEATAQQEEEQTRQNAEREFVQLRQQLQEARENAQREKNQNSVLLANMEAMDKEVQILLKSVTSPEIRKEIEQVHKHYVISLSEYLGPTYAPGETDTIKEKKNPVPSQLPK